MATLDRDGTAINERRNLMRSVWEYCGQRQLYDLHHLILTRKACDLVAFNTEKLALGNKRLTMELLASLQVLVQATGLHVAVAPTA